MFNTSSLSMRKQLFSLLTNKWAISCLVIMTFQQIIEASSSMWLVMMMKNISNPPGFLTYLFLYIGSLAIPYIPGCFAQILKTSWKQQAQRHFTNAFVSANRNNIGEWNNKSIKEEKLSILTSEGPVAIHALIDYVWDLSSYVLSVILNIAFLSIVVEPLFILAYAISVVCVFIIMKIQRRTQKFLTQKALAARVELGQSLLAAWDNVLLGNDYNFKLWDERTSLRLKRCLERNIELERFDQVLAISVSLITALPSLGVVVYFCLQHLDDPTQLSAFIVILPLLFMILSYTYQTLSLAFRWGMHKSKLTSIYRAIQSSKDYHSFLEKKVKWSKIKATLNTQITSGTCEELDLSLSSPRFVESHSDLLNQTKKSGRLTLRGENGSGKSTALMLIKNSLSSRAFFLPTYNQLSFSSETAKYSTGESLRKKLTEILEKVDVDVLLLDEWDANLDHENQESLSHLIDELSLKKCVIEVRHR
ncbi:thiol reductant ABC exporter, CydC subunit [Candidatus Rubidus massiliensis]|nr:MAG: hypothetical protein BGO10_00135 [Chlamydia sp. 32-24]CDZ80624.1 thiol reductant ABC exporter, CydC subunit [Candidatus Rubidus massiliensis]